MWKPTLVNWLFGAVFLGSHFIGNRTIAERLMSKAITVPNPVWTRLNIAWTSFFLLVGALNIFIAYSFSEEAWVNFKMFGIIGLTLAFVFGQAFYLSRYMVVAEEKEPER